MNTWEQQNLEDFTKEYGHIYKLWNVREWFRIRGLRFYCKGSAIPSSFVVLFLLNANKNMQNMLQRFYVIHALLAYIGNFPFFAFWNEIWPLLLPRNLIWVVYSRMSWAVNLPSHLWHCCALAWRYCVFTNRPFLMFSILRVRIYCCYLRK